MGERHAKRKAHKSKGEAAWQGQKRALQQSPHKSPTGPKGKVVILNTGENVK